MRMFKKQQTTIGSNGSAGSAVPGYQPAPSVVAYDTLEFAALVQRAERAAEALRSVESTVERGAELAAMEDRIAGLGRELAAVEQLAAQFAAVREQAERLAASQERADAQITATGTEVTRVTSSLGDLVAKIDAGLALGAKLENVGDLSAEFTALRGEAGAIRSQIRDLIENVARLRTVHDDVLRAHKQATIRLDGMEQRQQAAVGKLELIERRAVSADEALEGLLRLASGIPDVQHQLAVLKAIGDQVTQRTAALEQQRDAVERALAQSSKVVELSSQFEVALTRQEEQARVVSALEGKLAEVQSLHASVLARGAEIAAQQRQLDEAERDAGRELAGLREEMRASAERFELENRSLDAASERVAELRGFVKECETRLEGLDATARLAAETDARARSLAAQVGHVAEDVGRISAQAERLRAVRDDVGQLDDTLRELTERVERIEEERPMVDEV